MARHEDIDRVIGESDLLSAKKVIYAANMDEEGFTGNDTENERLKAVQAIADAEGAMVLPICAKLEEDIAGMDAEEKEMFLSELGLHESGLDRLIKVCYDLLGLMSYLTAGEQEVRATGPSKRAPRRRRLPARSTPTSNAALSALRSSTTRISSSSARWRLPAKRVWFAPRARNTSCRTAMLFCSASTYNC